MSSQTPAEDDPKRTLRVLTFNVWGLAFISKDRHARIRAIASYLASSNYDIVCLQELWVYKDYELIKEDVGQNLPFSRFFHTGALGSGLAIFTRFPLISAGALPYSLSGSPAQAFAGDFFVKKAAGNVVILHPLLGEVEIWTNHMHAAGEHPPDTRQAHRIGQSWQLANAVLGGAAKGRYILCMGDFNSQPFSIPIAMLRHHAGLTDSYHETHPAANDAGNNHPSPQEAIRSFGMTCDSPLNTYSAGKPIGDDITAQGGKRLDYIFYRQPALAKRRPLIWGYRDSDGWGDTLESGVKMPSSTVRAPKLRCVKSEVVLTEQVPGQKFSYSDHFGLFSTFHIDEAESKPQENGSGGNLKPLVPLMNESESVNNNMTTFAPISPTQSNSPSDKSEVIRSALNVLRLYTQISQNTAKKHMRVFGAAVFALIALTVGCAWQPKSWLQPIFTFVGGAIGAAGATFLYTGFVWGRWEMGLLTETTEEMELELRVVEMEDSARA